MGVNWKAVAAASVLPTACLAQEPLSAIPWLTEELGLSNSSGGRAAITASRIGEPSIDAVGILPARISGFPEDLWSNSDAAEIAALISDQSKDLPQAALRLLYMLLLAEADPPSNSGGSTVFLSRVDKLLSFGALEQARALLARAGPENSELFSRWFDIGLLSGAELDACSAMLSFPAQAPSRSAMIYCLAKRGERNAAAILYLGASAVRDIDEYEMRLLAQYIGSPAAFESIQHDGFPRTPLIFAMERDAGYSRPLTDFQDAFLFANLSASAGWKTRLESLEKLAASRAVSSERLLAAYSESAPAGSGGIWDRVRSVQNFDSAVRAQSRESIAAALPQAYDLMKEVDLEVAFANFAARHFADLPTEAMARNVFVEIAMLSDYFEQFASEWQPINPREQLLFGIATGRPSGAVPQSSLERAIFAAMQRRPPGGELRSKIEQGKLGEALLSALLLLEGEARFNPSNVQQALSALIWTGLEFEARGIALQLLADSRS